MFIEDELKRKFYLEMTRIEHWNPQLPDKKLLSEKLHKAIEIAKENRKYEQK